MGRDSFLSAANRYNLMPVIDRWVINHVIEALKPRAGVLEGKARRRIRPGMRCRLRRGKSGRAVAAAWAGACVPSTRKRKPRNSPSSTTHAVLSVAGLTLAALFAVGLGVSLFTGRHALRGAPRMVLIGGGAGAVSYRMGRAAGRCNRLSRRRSKPLKRRATAPRWRVCGR